MHVLALQAHVGSADVMTNDNEMTVLLLASDHWRGRAAPAIQNFARLISSLVEFKEQLLEQVIKCLREANTRLPDSHNVPFSHSGSSGSPRPRHERS